MDNEASTYPQSDEQPLAMSTLDDRASVRLVTLLGGHEWIRWRADLVDALSPTQRCRSSLARNDKTCDRLYFEHRSADEKAAASEAVGCDARNAHEELAARYAELAQRSDKRRSHDSRSWLRRVRAVRTLRRQDALLDQALTETFPASDPVSVAYVS